MRYFSTGFEGEQSELAVFPESRSEYLYRFLDNRIVNSRQGRWRICIYSVVETGEELWLQTGAVGPAVHAVLLRLQRSAEAQDALLALESWLSVPQSRDHRVIDVGHGLAAPSSDVVPALERYIPGEPGDSALTRTAGPRPCH